MQAQMERQQRDEAVKQALAQSTMGKNSALANAANARAINLAQPKPQKVDPLSQAGIAAKTSLSEALAKLKPAPLDPIKVHAANRDYDVKHPLPTQPGITYIAGGTPDNPQYFAGTTKGTPSLTPMGVQKPTAQGGGGSASLSKEDRQKMLNQARLDNETMKAYENKVLSQGNVPGFAAGAAGILAGAAPSGVVGGFSSLVGNAATGAIDPDYQRYITAQRSYGRIMGNLQSKRYTDHQAEIERSISGLQGNDLSSTIRYKQQLRDSSLADDSSPGTGAPAGAPKAAPSAAPAQTAAPKKIPTYEEWLKAKGGTE